MITEEITAGFDSLKELVQNIQYNIDNEKILLAKKQLRLLLANIDVLETEIEVSDI